MNPKIIAGIAFFFAFCIVLHQYLFYQDIWTWSQFLHHESFVFGLVLLGLGLLIGSRGKK